MSKYNIILASKSKIRQKILQDAGVFFETLPANIDEKKIKDDLCMKNHNIASYALTLATFKARKISKQHRTSYILGADQVLVCEGKNFDKPKSQEELRKNLLFLRGKTHFLHNGLIIAFNDDVIWQYEEKVTLRMRDFTDDFLDEYIKKAGEAAMSSVGGYQFEKIGIQLFSDIEGHYHSLLGLPLLPLLKELRNLELCRL